MHTKALLCAKWAAVILNIEFGLNGKKEDLGSRFGATGYNQLLFPFVKSWESKSHHRSKWSEGFTWSDAHSSSLTKHLSGMRRQHTLHLAYPQMLHLACDSPDLFRLASFIVLVEGKKKKTINVPCHCLDSQRMRQAGRWKNAGGEGEVVGGVKLRGGWKCHELL